MQNDQKERLEASINEALDKTIKRLKSELKKAPESRVRVSVEEGGGMKWWGEYGADFNEAEARGSLRQALSLFAGVGAFSPEIKCQPVSETRGESHW